MRYIFLLFGLLLLQVPAISAQSDSTEIIQKIKAEGDHLKQTIVENSFVNYIDQDTKDQIPLFHKSFKEIIRSLFGILVFLFLAFLLSDNHQRISWKTVISATVLQIVLAFCILYVPAVDFVFTKMASVFIHILDFSKVGARFVFGDLVDANTFGVIFAFQVLPTIVFLGALTSLLFYFGIIQKVVWALAWVMVKAFRISGAESLAVAGNIFLGQVEAPLLVKEYLPFMNKSEFHLIMTSGMATLAGSVLVAYIGMLGGDDIVQRALFAKHLLTASVMAAPGAVVIAKLMIPQNDDINDNIKISSSKAGENFFDAITNGTVQGLKLAVNIGAILLVFVAIIALLNYVLGKVGVVAGWDKKITQMSQGNYTGLSLQFILGYVFYPLIWLVGVASEDITLLARLLGEKIILTEFIGYASLTDLKEAGAFVSQKSVIIAVYMLSGFANFASVGILIVGLGNMAPSKKVLITTLGMKALIGGTLASLLSATIIGLLI